MGRKIPKSKKHKKLKAIDPFYKGDRKGILDKNAEKSNAKPSNPDVQEVPRKLKEIMQSKELIKEGKIVKVSKKRKKTPAALGDDYGRDVKGVNRRIQYMPIFEKHARESDKQFLARIEAYSRNVIAETKLEDKFNVIITEDRHGNVEVNKPYIDVELEQSKSKKVKKSTTEAKKMKRKKLEIKKKEKKQSKIKNRIGDFDHLKDQVKFGEVVAQPPVIKYAPRKALPFSATRKPGEKQLLLKEMLGSKQMKEIRRELHLGGISGSKVDRTVKRKYLSVSERRKLDSERENAVQAYRIIKKTKQMKIKKGSANA